jgi:hypothetical protein
MSGYRQVTKSNSALGGKRHRAASQSNVLREFVFEPGEGKAQVPVTQHESHFTDFVFAPVTSSQT